MIESGRRVGSGPLLDAVETLRKGNDAPPGVCVAVSGPAGAQWAAGGWAQVLDDEGTLPEPVAMDLHTRSDAGSLTKVMATTSCLARLVDAGAASLDAECHHLLPSTRGAAVGTATLRQLLTHSAGLWEWWPLYVTVGAGRPDVALGTIVSLPPRYRPGAGRHYSDLGFQLLGLALQECTGRTLDELVGDLVLEPASMASTSFAAPAPGGSTAASSAGDAIEAAMVRTGRPYPVDADADSFDGWRDHVLVGEVNDGNAFHVWRGTAGHAGLFTTADDLVRFGRWWCDCLDGSGPIDPTTARRFATADTDPTQALGWRVGGVVRTGSGSTVGAPTAVLYHTGFPGTGLAVVPELGTAVALVTNRLHAPGPPVPTEPMLTGAVTAALAQQTGVDEESGWSWI